MKTGIEDVHERLRCLFYCGASATEGLRLIKEYSDRFNSKPVKGSRRYVVEFRLVGITEIPDSTDLAAIQDLDCQEISRRAIDEALAVDEASA